ncbi:MAG: hypothetical protein Q8S11_07065 [Daejeonella sp.]|uniref:hypothetical protein n=1 Tax=Daejeonella sp. TaxID=2805397 RepID=UPI0027366A10|nr:hypothetical protein [Daejeonella sp.]MDP3468077.1 hypothetical protein [Daejeonella sp.]
MNKKDIKATITKIKDDSTTISTPRFLDEVLIEAIRCELPDQPWQTGIHKMVASKLQLSNKLVSDAIKQLIVRGIFRRQVGGKVIMEVY